MREHGASNASPVLEISVHLVHCPIEFARFCVKQKFRSFKETTTTRSETHSRIANAVIPILATTISPSYLTTTLFGTRAATTKPGCGTFCQRIEVRQVRTAFCS